MSEKTAGAETAWLLTTLRQLADAVIATDAAGRVSVLNAAAERLIGWQSDDVIGRPIGDFLAIFSEGTGSRIEDPVKSAIGANTKAEFERDAVLVSRNGDRIPVHGSAAAIRNGEGELLGVSIVLRDISQFLSSEARVREANKRFRIVADSAPVLIWLSGTDRLFTFFNAGWLQFTGKPMSEQIGNGWQQVIHPDDVEGCVATYEAAFDRREPFNMQCRFRRHDGEYRWILNNGVPRFDESGQFAGYIGSCIDLTEEILATEKVKASEARLSGLVDSAMDAIITVDERQRITLFNKAAESMFGYTSAEILGKPLDRLIPQQFRDSHRRQVREFGRTGVTSRSMYSPGKLSALRSDGREFPIEATISQVVIQGDKLYSVIVRDVSEKHAAEAALRRSERLAATGRLAATIAHEINNPLESVMNLVYLAKVDRGQIDRYLEIAERELTRVAMITRQTLGFYRDVSAPVLVDLQQLLNEILAIYVGKIEAKSLHVVRNYNTTSQVVEGLRGELGQIFANLVANAIDACPRHGQITIEIVEHPQHVTVTVADNGHGIPKENMDRIFEPFFTTKKSLGTGLGLWVVRDLLEKNGGSLSVKSSSTVGKSGSRFEVRLPRKIPHVLPIAS